MTRISLVLHVVRYRPSLGFSSLTLKYPFLRSESSVPSKYSRSRHAVKHNDVNFDFSHVMDSFKDHRGGVCLVNVMNPSTKPAVDAQAPNATLWLRVKVS